MSALKFRFSWKVSIICGLLAAGMICASFWQWRRHQGKLLIVDELNKRLNLPVTNISDLLPEIESTPETTVFRRVRMSGEFDFEREIILRNRRYEASPGVFVLTPFKIDSTEKYILVSRGFIPLGVSEQTERKLFRHDKRAEFNALTKGTNTRRLFAPSDPPSGKDRPWVDAWLRVDIENIEKQMPYDLLPVYAEIMGDEVGATAAEKILSVKSGRDEIFQMTSKIEASKEASSLNPSEYPIPIFDTVVPPMRHLGYVYEWAIMALLTICIAIVLQLRRPQAASK